MPKTTDLPTASELERWSRLPLERLQALERRIYGAPLSHTRYGAERPDSRWEDSELASFIAELDAQIAEQPVAKVMSNWRCAMPCSTMLPNCSSAHAA